MPSPHIILPASSLQQGVGDFSWTVKEQGMILGTFFWGYFFTKTIGG